MVTTLAPLTLTLLLALAPAAAAEWSTLAATCTPSDRALSLVRNTGAYVTLRAGTVSTPAYGAPPPLQLRCALPAQPADGWQALEVVYTDPDGAEGAARIWVELRRVIVVGASGETWVERLAKVESSRAPGPCAACVHTGVTRIPSPYPEYPEATATYWINITLIRTTTAVAAPRVYTVRLR